MNWQRPSPRVVWKAIQTYLAHAYHGPPVDPSGPGGPSLLPPIPASTPSAVRARLETLRSTPDEAFYDSPVFERGAAADKDKRADGEVKCDGKPDNKPGPLPAKYLLRLGNRFYPHMKLVIDRAPHGDSYLIRADHYTLSAVVTGQRADGKIVTLYYWATEPQKERTIEATIWDPGKAAK